MQILDTVLETFPPCQLKQPVADAPSKSSLLKPVVDQAASNLNEAYDGTQAKMLAAHHAAKQHKLTSKTKNVILENYEQLYGDGTTAKVKGKDKFYPTTSQLVQESTMKPDLEKKYRVRDLSFYNIIAIVLGHCGGFLLPKETGQLALLNTTFFW